MYSHDVYIYIYVLQYFAEEEEEHRAEGHVGVHRRPQV